jgi:hypothetical protein
MNNEELVATIKSTFEEFLWQLKGAPPINLERFPHILKLNKEDAIAFLQTGKNIEKYGDEEMPALVGTIGTQHGRAWRYMYNDTANTLINIEDVKNIPEDILEELMMIYKERIAHADFIPTDTEKDTFLVSLYYARYDQLPELIKQLTTKDHGAFTLYSKYPVPESEDRNPYALFFNDEIETPLFSNIYFEWNKGNGKQFSLRATNSVQHGEKEYIRSFLFIKFFYLLAFRQLGYKQDNFYYSTADNSGEIGNYLLSFSTDNIHLLKYKPEDLVVSV